MARMNYLRTLVIILISTILIISSQLSYSELSASNKAVVIKIDGGIGPAVAEYVASSIKYAEESKAELLIIELNTPGGLLESTRDIVTYIMESRVPIAVYVSPKGSRAGSAGVFITLSAHIAAMAPGTNIGAAHPVGLGGEGSKSDSNNVMTDKVTNDAAAFVRTIAQNRGRNESWAELTVRESIASTEREALDSGAIDYIAYSISDLLNKIDGKSVVTKGGATKLNTNGIVLEYKERNWKEELMQFLSDPNLAYIFILLGIYGIFFELYSPGSIFPGSIGAISILLGAYSLQMLPVNYIGLGLIGLSVIFLLLEIYITSYGLLSIAGIVSFSLGSIMLIDSPIEIMNISTSLIITAIVLTTAFFSIIIYYGIKAQKNKHTVGKEGIRGEIGYAVTDITAGGYGSCKVHGEIWKSFSDIEIRKNDKIKVVEVVDLKLKVTKA